MAESFDGSGNEWRAHQEGSVPSAWVWSQYKGEFTQTMSGREGVPRRRRLVQRVQEAE